jgi:uncharacterized protein (DUF1778 family)
MNEWEEIPNVIRPHKPQSYFTFSIPGSELTLIQHAAKRQNEHIDEFIRKAALRAALESNPEQITLSRADAARLYAVLEALIKIEQKSDVAGMPAK